MKGNKTQNVSISLMANYLTPTFCKFRQNQSNLNAHFVVIYLDNKMRRGYGSKTFNVQIELHSRRSKIN